MVLPVSYVAEHPALAYASTVHAAQRQTVDSSHAVITSWTSPAALYIALSHIALSRGRDANTAHVATGATVDDPAQGSERHQLHRDPAAVLAGLFDTSDPIAARSALAIATASAQEAGSVRTAAELLAVAAQLAATERTAVWLDRLTDTGALTPGSVPGSPPKTAPPRSPAFCAGPSWPAPTPARPSSTRSPTAR
jgi:hypothetical protein